MERALLALALIAAAVVAAAIVARRRPDAPTQPTWTVPAQLDRGDFDNPQLPWLVVVFSSATCAACAGAVERARPLASPSVAVQEVPFPGDRALHERYAIDAVPTTLVADAEGVVRASFVGPLTATDLWATLAELREPGSTPPGCDHGQPGAATPGSD